MCMRGHGMVEPPSPPVPLLTVLLLPVLLVGKWSVLLHVRGHLAQFLRAYVTGNNKTNCTICFICVLKVLYIRPDP